MTLTRLLPWTRAVMLILLVGVVIFWWNARGVDVVPHDPSSALPEEGIAPRGPADEARLLPVVIEIIALPVETAGAPVCRVRLGDAAWDGEVPDVGASVEEQRAAGARWKTVFEEVVDVLRVLRAAASDPEGLEGEVRKGSDAVPASVYMGAFQAFLDAGFTDVTMVTPPAMPPGR